MSIRSAPAMAIAVSARPDPDVLGDIALPGVAVALWQHRPDPAWQTWLDGISPDRLPRLRQELRPADATVALAVACDAAGLPESPERRLLIDRIGQCAALAARHLGTPSVTLRLDVSEGQACPKWHLDAVRARLLATLRGAGTQFGPATGHAKVAAMWQMRTGEVALFRGRSWRGVAAGILHRSPPATPGQTRLLVVVDPAS